MIPYDIHTGKTICKPYFYYTMPKLPVSIYLGTCMLIFVTVHGLTGSILLPGNLFVEDGSSQHFLL